MRIRVDPWHSYQADGSYLEKIVHCYPETFIEKLKVFVKGLIAKRGLHGKLTIIADQHDVDICEEHIVGKVLGKEAPIKIVIVYHIPHESTVAKLLTKIKHL